MESVPTVQTPDDERLHRLTVEAAKFKGLNTGEPLPINEIVAQARANGYEESDVREWLENEGYASVESIPVPPQGDALGTLWRDYRTPTATFSPEVQTFDEWLAEKREKRCVEYDDGTYQHKVEHAYSLHTARERNARARDVERHFIEEYERFTTVLVTYCAEREPNESIAENASKFNPTALSRTRWNIFNRDIDTEEYAGVRLLAPGKPDDDTPMADFTHGHEIYCMQGWHSVEDFEPLRETFLAEVEGAHEGNNPLEDMIQVQHHTSAEIETHPSVKRQELDAERGPTTSASGEVGANLPLLRARNALRERDASSEEWAAADASECPDWIQVWCAHLWHGVDDKTDRSGVSRYGELGAFDPIAESMKEARGYDDVKTDSGGQSAENECADLSDKEQDFVEAYLDVDAPTDRETIERNITENIHEFGPAGVNVEQMVQAIRHRV